MSESGGTHIAEATIARADTTQSVSSNPLPNLTADYVDGYFSSNDLLLELLNMQRCFPRKPIIDIAGVVAGISMHDSRPCRHCFQSKNYRNISRHETRCFQLKLRIACTLCDLVHTWNTLIFCPFLYHFYRIVDGLLICNRY